MDNKFLILVEGDSDIVIISTVLSHLLHNEIHQRIHFYKCNGYYNMLSSIRPFLDSYDPSIKILATFDADTASIEKVKEKIDFVKEYVNYNYYKDRLEIVCFTPTIDVAIECTSEILSKKRNMREEYNQAVSTFIVEHLKEIEKLEAFKQMINYINSNNHG